MKTIKFSHRYAKFWDCSGEAVLLQVIPVRLRDLSPSFLEYDTLYFEKGFAKNYPLKGDKMLMLIFQEISYKSDRPEQIVFTTLRAAWPSSKEAYYRKSIGETFKITYPISNQVNV